MAKHKIMVARPTGNGWERVEIGNTLLEIAGQSLVDPDVQPFIEDLAHSPINRFPTSVARNVLAKKALELKCDYLLMMDVDGGPIPGSFKALFTFLRDQPVPSIAAVPYASGDGSVQVFTFTTQQWRNEPLDSWALTRIPREMAMLKTGFERVASIGTHFVMIDCRVFGKLKTPYFAYGYNEDHTEVTETEDCYFMRNCFYKDIPIWVAWDYPAVHYKEQRVVIQSALDPKMIPEFFREKAETAVCRALLSDAAKRGVAPEVVAQEILDKRNGKPLQPETNVVQS